MGKLIVSTDTAVDGIMSVDEWLVSEGDHADLGRALLERDFGVVLLRYEPAFV